MLGDDRVELFGDEVIGLVPGNLAPVAGTAVAHAQHGTHRPLLVQPLGKGGAALGAEARAHAAVVAVPLDPHRLIVLDLHGNGAAHTAHSANAVFRLFHSSPLVARWHSRVGPGPCPADALLTRPVVRAGRSAPLSGGTSRQEASPVPAQRLYGKIFPPGLQDNSAGPADIVPAEPLLHYGCQLSEVGPANRQLFLLLLLFFNSDKPGDPFLPGERGTGRHRVQQKICGWQQKDGNSTAVGRIRVGFFVQQQGQHPGQGRAGHQQGVAGGGRDSLAHLDAAAHTAPKLVGALGPLARPERPSPTCSSAWRSSSGTASCTTAGPRPAASRYAR